MRLLLAHLLFFAILLPLRMSGRGASNIRLTGVVEDPTSAPIPRASVTLLSINDVLQMDTLQNGSFVFDNVPAGTYKLKVELRGFFREKLALDIHKNTPRLPLVIRLKICMSIGSMVCGPDFPVSYGPPGAANSQLEGVVYHNGGPAPIANAEVTLQSIDDAQPPRRSQSDHAGRFTFKNLPAGVYDLKVAKSGFQPIEVKRLIKPRGHDVFIQTSMIAKGIVIVDQ